MKQPKGFALYLRAFSGSDTPAKLVKVFKDHHVHWVAIGGPWHDATGQRFINRPSTCKRYAEAFETAGIRTYAWGYPWQGTEDRFLDEMEQCAPFKRWLLDPELGINPTRKSSGPGWTKAVDCATRLVAGAKARADEVGMSSYGIPPKWFPLDAFTKCDWGGGQTYTKNELVMRSIRLFTSKFALTVPNFGLYTEAPPGPDGKRKVRSKTPEELKTHLQFFFDALQSEAVAQGHVNFSPAMIGWAENFMNQRLWTVLQEFAERLESIHT